jgi:hypothetical protein
MLKLQWKPTWVLSTVETLLCSTASGSIFFLMARLLTVMVSVFTGYKEMKGNTWKLKSWHASCSQVMGVQSLQVIS